MIAQELGWLQWFSVPKVRRTAGLLQDLCVDRFQPVQVLGDAQNRHRAGHLIRSQDLWILSHPTKQLCQSNLVSLVRIITAQYWEGTSLKGLLNASLRLLPLLTADNTWILIGH